MYSLNKKGPCINGGILICKGEKVAPLITCECPPHYKGMFCEEKMENVIKFVLCLYCLLLIPWTQHGCKQNYLPHPTYYANLQFRSQDSVIESQTLQLVP